MTNRVPTCVRRKMADKADKHSALDVNKGLM
jgi:hypothetical protein